MYRGREREARIDAKASGTDGKLECSQMKRSLRDLVTDEGADAVGEGSKRRRADGRRDEQRQPRERRECEGGRDHAPILVRV